MKQVKFKALNYLEENVGKVIKNSKKKTIWQFEINSRMCYLVLQYSKFSGNYSVELNKKVIYKGNKTNDQSFSFPFILENVKFEIIGKGYSYQLNIKGKSFQNYCQLDQQRKTYLVDQEINLKHIKKNTNSSQKQRMTSLQKPPAQFRQRAKTANLIKTNFLENEDNKDSQQKQNRPKNHSVFKKKKQLVQKKQQEQQEVIINIDLSKEQPSNMFVDQKPYEFRADQSMKKRSSEDFDYFETSEIQIWKNQNSNKDIDVEGMKLVYQK